MRVAGTVSPGSGSGQVVGTVEVPCWKRKKEGFERNSGLFVLFGEAAASGVRWSVPGLAGVPMRFDGRQQSFTRSAHDVCKIARRHETSSTTTSECETDPKHTACTIQ